MSVRVTVSCNGKWPGKPCSAAVSFTPHMSAAKAREKAEKLGWSVGSEGDLCPTHTRALARDRAKRGTV